MQGKPYYRVYRPALVLARAKDLYTRQPLTLEHPQGFVDGANYRDYALGWTGDESEVEWLPDLNEVIIRTTLNMIDNEGVDAYDSGLREVSPGYVGTFRWESGIDPNGNEYDIIMDDVVAVNHLALCKRGRGGSAAAILDSKGVHMKKPSTGLFHIIRSIFVGDAKPKSFRDALTEVVQGRATLDPDALAKKIEKVAGICDSLPDSEGKSNLLRLMDDMKLVKDHDDAVALKAVDVVAGLYEKLDKQVADSMPEVVSAMAPVSDELAPEQESGGDPPKEQVPSSQEKGEPAADETPAPAPAPVEEAPAAAPALPALPAQGKVPGLEDIGPDPSLWSPEQAHRFLAKVWELLPAIIPLMKQEAVEPEHAAIAPELAGAGDTPPEEETPPEEKEEGVSDSSPFNMHLTSGANKGTSGASGFSDWVNKNIKGVK